MNPTQNPVTRLAKLPEPVRAEIQYQVDLRVTQEKHRLHQIERDERRIQRARARRATAWYNTLTTEQLQARPVLHPGDTPEICAQRRNDLLTALNEHEQEKKNNAV